MSLPRRHLRWDLRARTARHTRGIIRSRARLPKLLSLNDSDVARLQISHDRVGNHPSVPLQHAHGHAAVKDPTETQLVENRRKLSGLISLERAREVNDRRTVGHSATHLNEGRIPRHLDDAEMGLESFRFFELQNLQCPAGNSDCFGRKARFEEARWC
jgi:hypothetical protein